ncbi:Pyridine nucleotide-disulphide oxidoreductase,FAD/NAD(P)-binding domain [Ostreococcus tauri]|uniref:Pyridine nucleotide-disulphide oxidoreductase,FAD/NAD(P)-binding domain n=1 Tax=Ostreococcus tauri TaxID=70448 RepID=A0A096P875_OSTTA|nr:Pyridine nucleotide-disulphide oxidoreductase,FAD/NAD(P)-binding domain [Ostreococcus tauri]CEG00430.1 Pyridine nucleotide-disulphide oxidoreductase,FAD/NAD(P)-binding domain [Ostreococcus tauri]|eukprot:XP_022840374.1 Pyridine nucleotide-disulphide oxidoreductase,FAD/NAD(P)-binding domain [Ostreococcus tauri]
MCRACRARGRARASTSSPVTVVDAAVDVACAPCDDDDASATPRSMRSNYDVVVVGAGAAGASFARTWSDESATRGRSCVVVARDGAATMARAREIGRRTTRWDAETTALGDAFASTIDVVRGDVVDADAVAKTVMIRTALGATRAVGYGTLVIASGGVPRSPTPAGAATGAVDVRFVRDVESVDAVARALGDAARGAKRVGRGPGTGGVAPRTRGRVVGRA